MIKQYRRPWLAIALCPGILMSTACKKFPAPFSSTFKSATPQPQLLIPPVLPPPRPAVDAAAKIKARAERDVKFNAYIKKRFANDPAQMEAMLNSARKLNAYGDAKEIVDEINRRTMVVPAPADFKPEPVARKIRLQLFLEKSMIRRGERLRFHLQMQNVGREAIDYHAYDPSIFKTGSLWHIHDIRFMVTGPDHKPTPLLAPLPSGDIDNPNTNRYHEINLPPGTTGAQKEDWMLKNNGMLEANADFEVKLLPGETLCSIGDDDSPQAPYRTLMAEDFVTQPGTYQLQVELDDRPVMPSKDSTEILLEHGDTPETIQKSYEQDLRKALGPVLSNVVAFEVMP